MRIFYPSLFALLIFLEPLLGQQNNNRFKYLTINEGLSQNTVVSIVQDSLGFIWFGTLDGLNRFDGYTIKSYFNNFSDKSSISSNKITTLTVDHRGNIWIGTRNGLNKYSQKTGKFSRIKLDSNTLDNLSKHYINAIFEDSERNILIGTKSGLYIRFEGEIQFNRVPLNNVNSILDDYQVSSIIQDKSGSIWLGTNSGLAIYDINENIAKIIENSDLRSLGNVLALCEYSDAKIWVGSQKKGLLIFDTKTGIVKQNFRNVAAFSSPSQNQIKQIYNDKNGNTWFATWEGLHSFNEKEKKLSSFTNKNEIGALNNNAINCVMQDKSGIIWVGTSFGGVNYFAPNMDNFKLVNISKGLSNNIISSFAEDNTGNIWVGTIGGGINKIDVEGRVLEQISTVNSTIKSDLIRSLAANDNYLWIGYWDNYLSRYNMLDGTFKHYNLRNLEFDISDGNSVRSIFISKDNSVWLGTSHSGLIKFSPTGEVKQFSPNSDNPLLGNNTKKMFYDKKGDFWVLNKHGLNRYDEINKTFKQYYFEKNDPMNNSEMMNVYVDNSNIFWIGTYGNGLIKLNVETMKYENYSPKSNLSGNVIYGILSDEDGLLWLSTNNGLARFNPSTGKSTNFNVENGLQSNEFNDNAFLKSSNGALFFGGIAGINIFKPSAIKKNTFVPPIEITNISLLNSSIGKSDHLSRIKDKKLVLDYSENDFSIEFAALSYLLPERNLYAYKLEPANDNWININTRRELTFTNLEPGNYTLRIKGSNNDGIWNETGTRLSITVLPPFWMTWWFRTLSVLLIIGIIATIIFIKVNELLRVEKLRIKIASDLHDDVGASLTKITMNAGLLDYETEESKIKNRTQNLIELSQNVISTMSDIVWSIDARNDTIGDMIDRMKNFSLNLASEKGIEVNFNIVSPNPNRKVNINKRQNFYLIYKEAFHNAVKYAETSSIDVKISSLKNELNFELADNGIGLPKENRRKGNGIRNMKMRAERINADLKFLNENGLTIRLNVKKL